MDTVILAFIFLLMFAALPCTPWMKKMRKVDEPAFILCVLYGFGGGIGLLGLYVSFYLMK